MTTTLVGAAVIVVDPRRWLTTRGKTSSSAPDPVPGAKPVGTEERGPPEVGDEPVAGDVGVGELLPDPEQAVRTVVTATVPTRDRAERRVVVMTWRLAWATLRGPGGLSCGAALGGPGMRPALVCVTTVR